MSACQFVEKGVQEPAEISQAHLRVGIDLEAPHTPSNRLELRIRRSVPTTQ